MPDGWGFQPSAWILKSKPCSRDFSPLLWHLVWFTLRSCYWFSSTLLALQVGRIKRETYVMAAGSAVQRREAFMRVGTRQSGIKSLQLQRKCCRWAPALRVEFQRVNFICGWCVLFVDGGRTERLFAVASWTSSRSTERDGEFHMELRFRSVKLFLMSDVESFPQSLVKSETDRTTDQPVRELRSLLDKRFPCWRQRSDLC